jgi:hypothetical protein
MALRRSFGERFRELALKLRSTRISVGGLLVQRALEFAYL